MFCFKFKIKKSTENPVGGWSRGGPPSSCDGSVNGEATPNALMEPRYTSHTLTQHNITEQHLMFSAYQLFANFTLPNFFFPSLGVNISSSSHFQKVLPFHSCTTKRNKNKNKQWHIVMIGGGVICHCSHWSLNHTPLSVATSAKFSIFPWHMLSL